MGCFVSCRISTDKRVARSLCHSRATCFYNMSISIFGTFGWKIPIHAPKIGFFGQFDPINGLQYQPKSKRHTLPWVRVIWATKHENVVSRLTISLKRGINKKRNIVNICPEAPHGRISHWLSRWLLTHGWRDCASCDGMGLLGTQVISK